MLINKNMATSTHIAMHILIVYGMYLRAYKACMYGKHTIAYKDGVCISRDCRFEHCKLFDNKHCKKC